MKGIVELKGRTVECRPRINPRDDKATDPDDRKISLSPALSLSCFPGHGRVNLGKNGVARSRRVCARLDLAGVCGLGCYDCEIK